MILSCPVYEHGIFLPLFKYSLPPLINIFLGFLLEFSLFLPCSSSRVFWGKGCSGMFLQDPGPNQTQQAFPLPLRPFASNSDACQCQLSHTISHLSLCCPLCFNVLAPLLILVNTCSLTNTSLTQDLHHRSFFDLPVWVSFP